MVFFYFLVVYMFSKCSLLQSLIRIKHEVAHLKMLRILVSKSVPKLILEIVKDTFSIFL